ncbi:hexose kinase [uncultured Microbacterium sp.]|uniref:1-phosphofructokinase family hexose kinase n=1 Tax=uncultured Microbacterium sp. TaxID=191216 RepID=UPI0025ECE2F5|nr:hexose kinase [uncultured Microbacterium sp.]
MARIVTVTPNPAVDTTYRVAHHTVGETLRVASVERRAGGKGVNVARVLRTLERDVVVVAPLGGDAGRWMRRQLAAEGVAVRPTAGRGETRTTVTVVDDVSHPTVLAEPGPPFDPRAWESLRTEVGRSALPDAWVVVAGSSPAGAPASAVAALVAVARSRGARVLVDVSGPSLAAAAAAGAHIVKANAAEVCDATGARSVDAAMSQLSAHGATVVVSRGAEGMIARAPDGTVIRRGAVPGVSGNPTGAGDAATAGLVAALDDGLPLDTAVAWATVAGAAAVRHPLAGAVDLDALLLLAARAGIDVGGLLVAPSPVRRPS